MKSFFQIMKRAQIRYRSLYLFYILAVIVAAFGQVYMNRLSGEMSDAALHGDIDNLIRLLIMITGVLVIRAASAAISTLTEARLTANAGYKMRTLFIRHFLGVSFGKLEKTASGENLSIYSNDIPRAERLVTSGVMGIIANFVAFVSAFVFMLLISPSFTGYLFLAAIGMLGIQILLSLPIQKWSKRMSEQQAKFNAVVNDSLQNLSVVAAYSLDDVLEKRYMTAYDKFYATIKGFAKAFTMSVGVMFTLMFTPLIVIVVVLAIATIDGNMTLVDFIAFSTTIMVAAGGLMGMANGIGALGQSIAGAKRLLENTPDPLEDLTNGAIPDLVPSAISFKNVTFTYDAATPILALDDVSFDIAPGSKVAIVGGSGSGKSTILKLLLGLYEPTGGKVALGGTDITQFAKNGLRDTFAYVPQNSFLFPESIGKNITLEDNFTNMPRLEKACADAGILDFINTLPDKFDSVLSEAADNVSGGQRQRIAMARAFYKNAPVILFDEATSSLDPVTEAAVLDSFTAASSDKTVIIVAHRASAIASCDTLIVMDNGKVSAIGSHENLLATNDVYQNLYEAKGAAI